MFEKYGMDVAKVKRPKGCPSCNYKGYAGRVGIFEVLPITKEMQRLISINSPLDQLEKEAKAEGLVTIMQSGLEKIKSGITTLEEVMKVANE
jgi:type IV pilus assembly protein PilB